MQPDFGTTALIAATALTILFASSAKFLHVAGVGLTGVALGGMLAVAAPYRLERVTSFLSDNPDILGDGYHAHQSLVALGTGGWFGVGLGASRARWSTMARISGGNDCHGNIFEDRVGFRYGKHQTAVA